MRLVGVLGIPTTVLILAPRRTETCRTSRLSEFGQEEHTRQIWGNLQKKGILSAPSQMYDHRPFHAVRDDIVARPVRA